VTIIGSRLIFDSVLRVYVPRGGIHMLRDVSIKIRQSHGFTDDFKPTGIAMPFP